MWLFISMNYVILKLKLKWIQLNWNEWKWVIDSFRLREANNDSNERIHIDNEIELCKLTVIDGDNSFIKATPRPALLQWVIADAARHFSGCPLLLLLQMKKNQLPEAPIHAEPLEYNKRPPPYPYPPLWRHRRRRVDGSAHSHHQTALVLLWNSLKWIWIFLKIQFGFNEIALQLTWNELNMT